MAVNIPALVALVVFYILILVTGIWASRKAKKEEKKCEGNKSEIAIVGGRNINFLVGLFTMIATWVGGGYIMGIAEAVYSPERGLIWATAPPAYVITFLLAGFFFAKPMRLKRYVTMLDPFQHRYGKSFTAALLVPALISDILTMAAILAALGGVVSVIIELSYTIAIVLSAAVSIMYTLAGGLYSVAYTDVVQLVISVIGLCLCIPFLFLNPTSTNITNPTHLNDSDNHSWIGELTLEDAGRWVDEMLLLSVGGLAYQCLHQRILSSASSSQAQVTCFVAAGSMIIMAIPSVLIGVVAVSTDWNQTEYGLPSPYERGDAGKILPLTLQHLTPLWVSMFGIGSVAAAAMSSMDSILLSSASMFTQNIYKSTLRMQASEQELLWVIRVSVVLVGLAGASLAFVEDSVLSLVVVSGDLLYCVVVPQLICVLYCKQSNSYGAFVAYVVAMLLRGLSGEPLLGIPPVILYPGWREEGGIIRQYFPFRSLVMFASLLCIPMVSSLSELGFSHLLPQSWDVLGVFVEDTLPEKKEETASPESLNYICHTRL